ncbi:MAG: hypothetical protein IJ834_02070 [Paludibacteraceae bacterium]|nr:hypothetical protein [Paludibacteraceae bacterium]
MKDFISERDTSLKKLFENGKDRGGFISNEHFTLLQLKETTQDEQTIFMNVYLMPYYNNSQVVFIYPSMLDEVRKLIKQERLPIEKLKNSYPKIYNALINNKFKERTTYPFIFSMKDIDEPDITNPKMVYAIRLDEPYEILKGETYTIKQEERTESDERMEFFYSNLSDIGNELADIRSEYFGTRHKLKKIGKFALRALAFMLIGDVLGDIFQNADAFSAEDIADNIEIDPDIDDATLGEGLFGSENMEDGNISFMGNEHQYIYDPEHTEYASGHLTFTGNNTDQLNQLKKDLDYYTHQANISNDPTKWTAKIKDITSKINSLS